MRNWWPLFVALGAAAACSPAGGRGTLTARWGSGADSASLTMPATATWCPLPNRYDIRAFVDDTAFGMAVYPVDTTALSGSYSVLEPGGPVQVRPAAAVALRWMGKVEVQGWWGDSGSVSFANSAGGGLSGSGQAWLVSNLGPDSVMHLEFSFHGLRVKSDSLCDLPQPSAGVPVDSSASSGTPPAPGVD
ncbi:MAG TPA: hypothetical protein PK948_06730 [Gemmatimonadales bacterium]|nr:hypothetical protein [Gemmatimonadales bacterium]